jgi:hypothetical protein
MATLIACLAVSSSFAVSPKPIYEAVAGKLGPEGSAFGTQAFATSFAAALAKKGLTGFKVQAERVAGTPGALRRPVP